MPHTVFLPSPTGGTLGLRYPAVLFEAGEVLYDQKEVLVDGQVVGRVVNPRFNNGRCVCDIEYTKKESTMTRDRLKYLLDSGILQAAVDGKPLQYRMHDRASWFDVEGFPEFFVAPAEFRIKPKLNTPKVVRFGDLDQDTQFKHNAWCVIRRDGTGDIVTTRSLGECQIGDNDTVVLLA